MKPTMIIAAMLMGCSCIKTPDQESAMGKVVFSIRETTKASSGISESAVNHWCVMLFETGNPAACYYASSDSGDDITCVARKDKAYRVYAIANYPKDGPGGFNPSSVSTEEELMNFTSMLGGNTISGLTMIGSTQIYSLPSTPTSIVLTRLCSKICIKRISLDVTDPAYSGKNLILNALYLTNVYCASSFGEDHFTPSEDEDFWYNAAGWHGSGSIEPLDALVGDRGLSQTIADGGSYTRTHSFYAYPNATGAGSDSRTPPWSPRCTRLVIEATLGNKLYYYPVTISEMKRNHNYTVTEAIIHGPGSLDPEQEIPGVMDINITISSNSWDSEYYISETS